ncbi:hypothetical protein LOK49_LG15G01300 [Camellia lanceoleosa]|uniref:Uncharacterized protein n=1 Tax=Camellia lanceoleosa TaxID=1840588 RepID=A0ACC0F429_9ERIC|nr:hypothetical protein LOK49_LG15G01300 [Camellia lanceoleosa]
MAGREEALGNTAYFRYISRTEANGPTVFHLLYDHRLLRLCSVACSLFLTLRASNQSLALLRMLSLLLNLRKPSNLDFTVPDRYVTSANLSV